MLYLFVSGNDCQVLYLSEEQSTLLLPSVPPPFQDEQGRQVVPEGMLEREGGSSRDPLYVITADPHFMFCHPPALTLPGLDRRDFDVLARCLFPMYWGEGFQPTAFPDRSALPSVTGKLLSCQPLQPYELPGKGKESQAWLSFLKMEGAFYLFACDELSIVIPWKDWLQQKYTYAYCLFGN